MIITKQIKAEYHKNKYNWFLIGLSVFDFFAWSEP